MGLYEEHKKNEAQYLEQNAEWAKQQHQLLKEQNRQGTNDFTMNFIVPGLAAIGGELVAGPPGAVAAASLAKGAVEKVYHDKPATEAAWEGVKEGAWTYVGGKLIPVVAKGVKAQTSKIAEKMLKTPLEKKLSASVAKGVEEFPHELQGMTPEMLQHAIAQKAMLERNLLTKAKLASMLEKDASDFIKNTASRTTKYLEMVRKLKSATNKIIPDQFEKVDASLLPQIQKEVRTKLTNYKSDIAAIENYIKDAKQFNVQLPPDLEAGIASAKQAIEEAEKTLFKNVKIKAPSGITGHLGQGVKATIQRTAIMPGDEAKRLADMGFVGAFNPFSPHTTQFFKDYKTAKTKEEALRDILRGNK